jgi:hypothetical protein
VAAHKAFNLRRRDRRDVANDQLLFSRIFYYVSQVLGVNPLPEVYLKDNMPGDIQLANIQDKKGPVSPAFVVGQNLLQGRPEKEIAFVAARRLCAVRPEHYLRLALSTNSELKVSLLAGIAAVRPDFPVQPELQQSVLPFAQQLQTGLQPMILEQLAALVGQFLQNAPEVNLARWGHAVDATASRLGFIVCGDLEVAARLVGAEPQLVGAPSPEEKVKELILYSVSEEYFTVRKQLGLTIG